MTTINTLSQKMFLYQHRFLANIELNGWTLKLMEIRMNLNDKQFEEMVPSWVDIVICKNVIYTKNSKITQIRGDNSTRYISLKSLVEKLKNEVTARYDLNQKTMDMYCPEKILIPKMESAKKCHYKKYYLSTKDYLELMHNEIHQDKMIFRFMPLKDEIKSIMNLAISMKKYDMIFEFPLVRLTLKQLKNRLTDLLEMDYVIKMYFMNFGMEKKAFQKSEKFNDLESLKTEASKWTSDDLDNKKMSKWFFTRHELFAMMVCKSMGWDMGNKGLDVDITERFGYSGPGCFKTPDLALEIDDSIILIDFKVTEGDPGLRVDETKRKYEDLRYGLGVFLNKDVKVEVIAWKINSFFNISAPDFCKDNRIGWVREDTFKTLREIYTKLSLIDNYKSVKDKISEDTTTDVVDEDKTNMYLEMLTKYMAIPNLKDKSTVTLSTSRKEGKETFVMMDQQEIKDELNKSCSYNHVMYKNHLTLTMMQIIEENKVPNYLKDVLNDDVGEVDDLLKMAVEKSKNQRDIANNCPGFKIPKLFKLPLLSWFSEEFQKLNLPKYFLMYNTEFKLPDGTCLLSQNVGLERVIDHENPYLEEGIGMDKERDVSTFTDLINVMMEESKDCDISKASYYNFFKEDMGFQDIVDDFSKSNIWAILEFWTDLVTNICYLNGRRHLFDKKEGHTVVKKFEKYVLFVRRGSKLTSEKQIRFRVLAHKNDLMLSNSEMFHSWTQFSMDENLVWTKWLTISITDIKHFMKVRMVSVGLASDMRDKHEEENKMHSMEFTLRSPSFITYLLILMEHKKGTSTTNQLNRYLLHSALAFFTNRKKLVKDIMDQPIRSRLDSYMRACQMMWYQETLKESLALNLERISNLTSTDTDYDRVSVRSFYDLNKRVEFGVAMNEMYMANLFDKDAGFTDHKLKRIASKMTEAEVNFRSIKGTNWSKGEVKDLKEFMMSDDKFHTFDKNFVVSATKSFFDKNKNSTKMNDALLEAYNEVINEAMKMTSSLEGGPYRSPCLRFDKYTHKEMSFFTLFRMVKEMNTHVLLGMVSRTQMLEAVFALFPKDQIGHPREILIQAVMMRFCIRLLEKVSEAFCKNHEKEMLTKDRKKAQIQSEKMNDMKEAMRLNKRKKIPSVYGSMNMDASRWSPGFVVEHFLYFVKNWDIDENLKEFLLNVIISFSSKKMLVPERLKTKWDRKANTQMEYDPYVQQFREWNDENSGVVTLNSGTGQGMFHILSSMYHCFVDDFVDEVVSSVMKMAFDVRITQTTLISSDDKTKMMLFTFNRSATVGSSLTWHLALNDMCYRLANIHTNWKKSGFQFIITEFNSLFSIGKRMLWATCKDIYNAVSLPDLTIPEAAVNFCLSNVRRCMEHGIYLPTLKVLLMLNRKMLFDCYRFDEEMARNLTRILNTPWENMPFQLGFIPVGYVYETLIYGPEIHMFREDNSEEMKKFYSAIYSASSEDVKSSLKSQVPFSEVSLGKYWFELPSKLDKKLKKMKDDFFKNDLNMGVEETMEKLEYYALNENMNDLDREKFKRMTMSYFVGMSRNYEFQETMVVHSLVRALQLSVKRGIIMPATEEEENIEEELNKLTINLMRNREMNLEDLKRYNELKKLANRSNHDIVSFTEFILERGNQASAIFLMEGMRKVLENHEWVMGEMRRMNRVKKNTHPMMRTLRFYTSDIGTDANFKEIMEYLMDPSHNTTTRVSRAFVQIQSICGKDMNMMNSLLVSNPFRFVREFMNNTKNPLKGFVDFLKYYHKNLKFMKITMISDTHCSGNMAENLLNLYRTRTDPSCVYENREAYSNSEQESLFLTNVSLGNEREFIDFSFYDQQNKLEAGDSRLTTAMKLIGKCENEWTDITKVSGSRVFFDYNKRLKRKFWTDFKLVVVCLERDKVDLWYMYSSKATVDEQEHKVLFTLIKRDILEANMKGRGFYFKTREVFLKNEEWSFEVRTSIFKTRVRHMDVSFQVRIQFKTEGSSDESVVDNIDMILFSDRYTMEKNSLDNFEFKNGTPYYMLQLETPSLWELNNLFLSQGWVTERFIERKQRALRDTDAGRDQRLREERARLALVTREESSELLRQYNEGFGNIQLEETISGWMNPDYSNVLMQSEQEGDLKHSLLVDAMNAMLARPNEGEQESSVPLTERRSLINVMDTLVTRSLQMEVEIDRPRVNNLTRNMKGNRTNQSFFHRFLLMDIMSFSFNKYGAYFSDGFAMIIYNIIIKKMMTMINIGVMSQITLPEEIVIDDRMHIIRPVEGLEEYNRLMEEYIEEIMEE